MHDYISITASSIGAGGMRTLKINGLPDECPICRQGIQTQPVTAMVNPDKWDKEDCLQVICRCPRNKCSNLFIAYYQCNSTALEYFQFRKCHPFTKTGRIFSAEIEKVSPECCEIYRQAFMAEQDELTRICGGGYRKALEFLVKDYLVKVKPQKKNEILEKALGQCIEDDVDEPRIKETARRAVWLGNDETHYLRKWLDKDLEDLKRLIDLTMHWIEMEQLHAKAIESMPKKK